MARYVVAQMDDGYLEQFPIGAINHIGLPESTLPKEVGLHPLEEGQVVPPQSHSLKETSHELVCLTGDSGSAIRLLRSA